MHGEAQNQPDMTSLSHRPTLMEPHVSMGLLACGVISTAHWLGTEWVGEPWLGLPLGVWVVGATAGMAHLWSGQQSERRSRSSRRVTLATELVERARATLSECARRLRAAGASLRGEDVPAKATPRARPKPMPSIMASTGPSRIGVQAPGDDVDTLVATLNSEGSGETKFEPMKTPVAEPADCSRLRLAGAIRMPAEGPATIILPERAGLDAAWEDWSSRLALSYPGVFPARVDTARVDCARVDSRSRREVRLMARLAEANALLAGVEARTGARLTPECSQAHRERTERAMVTLARTLAADWSGESAGAGSAMCKSVARGVSAWLCTWNAEIDPQERRRWMEVCAALIADEPEAHLRLGTAHVGAFEDDESLPAFDRAFEVLRRTGELPLNDPLAFVMGELEVGSTDSLTLGRVASGLVIAWATTPLESLDYLRDDLADDLRHSDMLVGRDQDHSYLQRVMQHMERLRSDSLPLRVKAAA